MDRRLSPSCAGLLERVVSAIFTTFIIACTTL
jgi:hypothetical protein